MKDAVQLAAVAIAAADAFVFAAGAGMGVDSGLPDFRGKEGFWQAYPPYAKLGLRFDEMARPRWFDADPTLAWGFYGHRQNLYRATEPHAGFQILRRWSERVNHNSFVFTSNVDQHFQRASFDPLRIVEIHGSIEWLQCTRPCRSGIYPAPAGQLVTVDESTMRAIEPLPRCPVCGRLARPNILMFADGYWDSERTFEQKDRMRQWLDEVRGSRLVFVELGAGMAVATVRSFCELTAATEGATVIRINPRECEAPPAAIVLPLGALEALRAMDAEI